MSPETPAQPNPSRDSPQAAERVRPGREVGFGAWGWLPILTVVSAGGLTVVSVGNTMARAGTAGGEYLFWLGLGMLVAPFAIRLVSESPTRQERLGLIVWLGLALYVVKLMNSPNSFTYGDEFMHWHNVNSILRSQTLFGLNPILPISALYPGLPNVTAAVASLGGLSVFGAGILVVAAARLVMILALFWLAEELTSSARIAGLVVLIYTTNSNFLFFDAQFAYESLALPLVVLVLALAQKRLKAAGIQQSGLTLAAVIVISAVVITHHLSSYFVVAVLLLWSLLYAQMHWAALDLAGIAIDWYAGELASAVAWRSAVQKLKASLLQFRQLSLARQQPGPFYLMLYALIMTSAWLLVVANSTARYLGIVLWQAVLAVFRLITAEESGRTLFVSSTGYVAPVWERIIGLGSIALIVAILPFGLVAVWRRYRQKPLILVLAAMALTYLGMLGLRFAPAAWETSNRASEFLYLGLSFVLALGVTEILSREWAVMIGRIGMALALTWMFFGGIVAGWPENLRLARIDQVQVGSRVLQSQQVAAANWMLKQIGPGQVVAADDSNGRLLLTQASELALVGRNYSIEGVLEAPSFKDDLIQVLQINRVAYALIDRRRISWDNMRGYFFVPNQPIAGWDVGLFESDRLRKFDQVQGSNKIFDSGDIAIYDVRAMWDGTTAK